MCRSKPSGIDAKLGVCWPGVLKRDSAMFTRDRREVVLSVKCIFDVEGHNDAVILLFLKKDL